jgi:hypothetical protein
MRDNAGLLAGLIPKQKQISSIRAQSSQTTQLTDNRVEW